MCLGRVLFVLCGDGWGGVASVDDGQDGEHGSENQCERGVITPAPRALQPERENKNRGSRGTRASQPRGTKNKN